MTNDLIKEIEGELRVSHRDIAENLEVDQSSVTRLLTGYKNDFEEFGPLRFEIEGEFERKLKNTEITISAVIF